MLNLRVPSSEDNHFERTYVFDRTLAVTNSIQIQIMLNDSLTDYDESEPVPTPAVPAALDPEREVVG